METQLALLYGNFATTNKHLFPLFTTESFFFIWFFSLILLTQKARSTNTLYGRAVLFMVVMKKAYFVLLFSKPVTVLLEMYL